ncbi:hypothetical protein B0H11DRAFT_1933843 [Mycena galericulata]|nr:hypothetical protein B0H11DRAFT_1933843 [Mycena galericulata]
MSEHSINSVLDLDLILEILDCLAVPLPVHQQACDPTVLAACSTVCKSWSSHAQRLLFRRVIIPNNIYREPHRRGTTWDTLPSFLAAIDPATEHGRHLASSVLCFTLRHKGRERTVDPTGLATALLRTPNLRHLDVTTVLCDFGPETLALLPSENREHESEPLQLLSHKCRFGYPSALSTVLQSRGPHLRSLSITTLDVASATDHSSVPALRHCTRLERFELELFPEAPTLALLPRSIHALAISGLRDYVDGPPVDALIDALSTFPHLRTLTWLFCPTPPALVRICTGRGIELRASLYEMVDDNTVEMELINKIGNVHAEYPAWMYSRLPDNLYTSVDAKSERGSGDFIATAATKKNQCFTLLSRRMRPGNGKF